MAQDAPAEADLLIVHGHLMTCDDEGTVWEDGAVATAGPRILALGASADLEARFAAREVIDAAGQIIMPGLINAHTHTPMTLCRGLADDLPLRVWLGRMHDAAEVVLSSANAAAAARLAYVEMILGGTTTAVDMYFFPEALATAAIATGFRLITGPVFVGSAGPDGLAADERVARGRDLIESWRSEPLITPCVMPHSAYDVPPETLRQAQALADECGVLLSIHAAETRDEVADVRARHGATPIELLARLGMLSQRTVLAHGVHVSQHEIELLAHTGAVVVHCPLSNLKLGDGIAPVPEMMSAGVRLALGTDGPASSNDLDLWHVIRLAAVLHRGSHEDPTLTPAGAVLRMATSDAARALGMGGWIGSLEVGKLADIITVDLHTPHMAPMFDVRSHLVYAAGRADVRNVVINGRVVLRNRCLTTVDQNEAIAAVRQIAASIGAR